MPPQDRQISTLTSGNEKSIAKKKKQSSCLREVPLVELALENVSYCPVVQSASTGSKKNNPDRKRVTILNSVTTKISPYKLSAVMGPSGSGKTSLISVLADLTKPGDVPADGGLITVNGDEGKLPKRLVGVVWQDDLLLSNLTVEENLYFCARLKTPEATPDEAVRTVVEETMDELGFAARAPQPGGERSGQCAGRFRGRTEANGRGCGTGGATEFAAAGRTHVQSGLDDGIVFDENVKGAGQLRSLGVRRDSSTPHDHL